MKQIPYIVVPTIRSKKFFKNFLDEWEEEFKGCHLIVVEDRKKKQLQSLLNSYEFESTIYDWRDIDRDLKDKSWIIPRQTDCVRSYGYYKAWQEDPLFIVTLDDDIKPQEKHIENFYKKLFLTEYQHRNFYNTMKDPHIPRGTMRESIGCDVAHGCWLNVPDLSAKEQIKNPLVSKRYHFNEGLVPRWSHFSMCGMNIAWKPEITKDMYFGLQGKNYPIDRFGDIWCGNHLTEQGYSVHTGEPFCTHNRASNIWSNLKKENQVNHIPDEYYIKLKEAREIWEGLFK